MAAHAITLHLPETLYRRFEQRARWTRRSVENELLDAVASAASPVDDLPAELIDGLQALAHSTDDELWRLAREAVPRAESRELEALHALGRQDGLEEPQQAHRAWLLQQYERAILTRAQAAKLLKDRGHDVSSLLAGQ